MYLTHFGLTHAPLGKQSKQLWMHPQFDILKQRFQWLLEAPGVGVLTAEPGVGKTAALRHLTQTLNPHQYQVVYVSETDFSRLDFYRQLAIRFGLEACYRRTQQWQALKNRITELREVKCIMPILIIDEAQNLSHEFLRDFPSFLNFAFDSKDMITVWFAGHPQLDALLDRIPYDALQTRIQVRIKLHPIVEREPFHQLIAHAFKDAGCNQSLLSESGIEIIRSSSQGRLRLVHNILVASLRLAADKKFNHLPDDCVQEAIQLLKGQ